MSDEQQQECPPCEKGAPKWVVTFGDMMSLLLTFFVLLLSFSTTDIVKYKRMTGSIKESFGVAQTSPDHVTPLGETITSQKINIPRTQAQLASIRAKAAKTAREEDEIDVESGANWFRIKIDGDALFDSGSFTVKPEAGEILDQVAGYINSFDGTVKIEGHTDDDRGARTRFDAGTASGNYELAGLRAISVLDFMVKRHNVDRTKLIPLTLGEFKPRDSNLTTEGKSRNRRVEFEFVGASDSDIGGAPGSFIRQ